MTKKLHTTIDMVPRPPVIAIMGHIDHGKSTLLDFIRKTNIVDKEAGGITQHIGAYEVIHTTKEGETKKITFLDTPGHAAFSGIRTRGARVADIAVLVVSAEDQVKQQTIEALKTIIEAEIPYIVAINKIDKPNANIELTKQSLATNEVYVEGYGGSIPFVPISAKVGTGVDELLDMILLIAEMEELKADDEKGATGVVIEANLDTKKGISATLIVQDGTLRVGNYIVADGTFSPVRMMENFLGKKVDEVTFSSPVKVIGWSSLPQVGATFETAQNKKEAEEKIEAWKIKKAEDKKLVKEAPIEYNSTKPSIPVVIKADASGSLEAVIGEIAKIPQERVSIKVIQSGIGDVSESDIKIATGTPGTLVLGFNVKVDSKAESFRERLGVSVNTFDIIYKLTEWLATTLVERTPKMMVEESIGKAKILKIFSKTKDKQIVGGKVEMGEIRIGSEVKITRRETEIGRGRIRELQQMKEKAKEVKEGNEFGTQIESKIEIAPGDRIECFEIVEK